MPQAGAAHTAASGQRGSTLGAVASLRCLVLAALLALAGADAGAADVTLSEASAAFAALLPAQGRLPDCRSAHPACKRCENTRIVTVVNGTKRVRTVVACSACESGWRLRRKDYAVPCECTAGAYFDGTTCIPCIKGRWCPGGINATAALCPTGLATIITGAKAKSQCMTTPGYGRMFVRNGTAQPDITSVLCPAGTYNVGGNSGACQYCATGLTTQGNGSSSDKQCVAPPGWYMRSGTGKPCPKGTYSPSFTNNTFCFACGSGLTTQTEGSKLASDCRVAQRGYFFNPSDATAQPCPLDTYQDTDNLLDSCKPCPSGLKTLLEGAQGLELCTSPPGFELLDGEAFVTECGWGTYKEDWRMAPCTQCGEGFNTTTRGAYNRHDCYIPPGWGLVPGDQSAGLVAQMCVSNTYGRPEPTYDVTRNAACLTCPPNTWTNDTLNDVPATEGYTSLNACLLMPGWGYEEGTSTPRTCPRGMWSPGFRRAPCTACAFGYTTQDEGATSADSCVVQPGWELDVATGMTQPCNKGTYSLGGTVESPAGACVPCPSGWYTPEDSAASPDDCSVCAPGHGGDRCALCPVNTYSFGSSLSACTPCGPGRTSEPGSVADSTCLLIWPILVDNIYIHASDESGWVDLPAGGGSMNSCQAQCAATGACFLLRYREGSVAASGTCQAMLELAPSDARYATRAAVGFKGYTDTGAVHDYAFYYVPSSQVLGILAANLGAGRTLKQCMDACTKLEDGCSIVRVTGNSSQATMDSCRLYRAELSAEWQSLYRLDGEHLYHATAAVATDAAAAGAPTGGDG